VLRVLVSPRRSRPLVAAIRALFVVAAIVPLLAPLLESVAWSAPLGAVLRALYSLQCHQRVGRSFTIFGATLPVCARCYGIYFGLGLAGLVGRPRLRIDAYKAWILVGAVVVVLDVATEWLGLRPANAWVRVGTGGALAYGIALAILESVRPRRR